MNDYHDKIVMYLTIWSNCKRKGKRNEDQIWVHRFRNGKPIETIAVVTQVTMYDYTSRNFSKVLHNVAGRG